LDVKADANMGKVTMIHTMAVVVEAVEAVAVIEAAVVAVVVAVVKVVTVLSLDMETTIGLTALATQRVPIIGWAFSCIQKAIPMMAIIVVRTKMLMSMTKLQWPMTMALQEMMAIGLMVTSWIRKNECQLQEPSPRTWTIWTCRMMYFW